MTTSDGHQRPPDVRPDPEPEGDLPLVTRSTVIHLNDGTEKKFPSLQDYVDQLTAQGIVKDLDDLVGNYSHLIGELFINWISTGQVGCLFAVKLARKPRENRWLPTVENASLSRGEALGGILSTELDAIAANHEAAILVFPDVNGEEQIITLVNLLCAHPSGRWYRTDGESDSVNLFPFGLRWILPSNQSVNYVLGFTDMPTMPNTRRSPFTALFFRVKDDKRTEEKRENRRMIVHLADLDSTFRPQEWHDRVWKQTQEKKKLYVETELKSAGRAKVTFTVSSEAAGRLCPAVTATIE